MSAAAEAARATLATETARLIEREAGTRAGNDPEDLHQMRVATRRLRAGFALFAADFGADRAAAARRDLRPIASRLGAVRDLDVALERLDEYAAHLRNAERDSERVALAPLAEFLAAARADARDRLCKELDSERFRRLVVELGTLTGSPLPSPGPPDHSARDVNRLLASVADLRPRPRHTSIRRIHSLRIAAKRLRYAIESLSAVLGPEADGLSRPATRLQEELGTLHDADASARIARQLLESEDVELAPVQRAAIRAYSRACRREVRALRRRAPAAWRATAGRAARRRTRAVLHGLG